MDVFEKMQKISTFIFDIDGVFTDGGLLVDSDGELLREMDSKDGFSVRLAIDKGYNILIISGAENQSIIKRFSNLGIKEIHLKIKDKFNLFKSLCNSGKIDAEKVMYVGDDLLDLELLKNVFLSAAPNDACHEILETVDFISSKNGGEGCIRDVIEKVLMSQGKWQL